MTTIDQSGRDRRLELLATAVVTAVAIAIAVAMFAAYYRHPEELWRNLWHDRSAHYGYGLDVALALRTFNPINILASLEAVRLWAPLHPALLSVVLAVGGIDYRLGVLPSLAGWVMTVVLTWLMASAMPLVLAMALLGCCALPFHATLHKVMPCGMAEMALTPQPQEL